MARLRRARNSDVLMNKMRRDTHLQVVGGKARQALTTTSVKNNKDNYCCKE